MATDAAGTPLTGCDADYEFEFAIDFVLDGVERMRLRVDPAPGGSTPEVR